VVHVARVPRESPRQLATTRKPNATGESAAPLSEQSPASEISQIEIQTADPISGSFGSRREVPENPKRPIIASIKTKTETKNRSHHVNNELRMLVLLVAVLSTATLCQAQTQTTPAPTDNYVTNTGFKNRVFEVHNRMPEDLVPVIKVTDKRI